MSAFFGWEDPKDSSDLAAKLQPESQKLACRHRVSWFDGQTRGPCGNSHATAPESGPYALKSQFDLELTFQGEDPPNAGARPLAPLPKADPHKRRGRQR